MGDSIRGSALKVGDVIWDNNVDTHPCLVIKKTQFQLTLRTCTSHESVNFETLKILKSEKTGDHSWSGKDSYLVTSSDTIAIPMSGVVGQQQVFDQVTVPTGRILAQQFVGPGGQLFFKYVPELTLMTVPRIVNVYGDFYYNRVGTVTSEKMVSILDTLG